jgi:glycopeptide antibiotics resistance protein
MPRLILALSWLIIISIAMLTPGNKLPDANYFDLQDKFIHFLCFSGLSFLWCGVGIKKSELPLGKNRLILFGLAAGIGLEYAQRFIPFRTFDFMDMIVNEIGGILGLLGYFKIPTTLIHLD